MDNGAFGGPANTWGVLLGAAIAEIINIFFRPLKDWVISKESHECDYRTPTVYKVKTHPIIVTKKMGKTKAINCVWFRHKKTENKEYEGKKYFYCPFGEPFDPDIKDGGKCPFV